MQADENSGEELLAAPVEMDAVETVPNETIATAARELFQKALNIYQRINRPKLAAKIQGMLKTVANMSAAAAAKR